MVLSLTINPLSVFHWIFPKNLRATHTDTKTETGTYIMYTWDEIRVTAFGLYHEKQLWNTQTIIAGGSFFTFLVALLNLLQRSLNVPKIQGSCSHNHPKIHTKKRDWLFWPSLQHSESIEWISLHFSYACVSECLLRFWFLAIFSTTHRSNKTAIDDYFRLLHLDSNAISKKKPSWPSRNEKVLSSLPDDIN